MDILDHFSALRAFDAVMRLGSIKAAAQALCLTDGAVSRKISTLEAALGHQLFFRQHRQVVPTALAVSIHADVRASFVRLAAVEEKLADANRTEGVTIAAPATFLSRWLIPRQAGLQKALGNIPILFTTYHGAPTMSPTPAQVFIAVGETARLSGAEYQPFMPQTLGLVIQRHYYESLKDTPDWARRVPRFTPASFRQIWSTWGDAMGSTAPVMEGPETTLERMHYAIEAVEAGQGCTIVPVEYVSAAIANGRLVLPFPPSELDEPFQYHVPTRFRAQPAVERVLRWLRKRGTVMAGDQNALTRPNI